MVYPGPIDVGTGAPRHPTMTDVAAASGVATSTVSRALMHPGRVHPLTRERVERAARDLGYRPHRFAAAAHREPAVGLLVPDVTNPFYFGLIRGTQQRLKAAGYAQVLVDTEESEEVEDAALDRLRGWTAGAILAASRLTDRRVLEVADRVRIVTVNRRTRGVPTVFIDTPAGMRHAVAHLVSLGHRDLAYAAGPDASWTSALRWRAVEEAAREYGIVARRLGPFPPTVDGGAAAADAVLATPATACIAFNDLLAIGVLERLRERGVPVPGRLSVVGCDDVFGSGYCSPPLTTLSSPIERAGVVAVELLLALLDPSRPRGPAVTLATHLTIRASTGAAPSGSGGRP